MTTPSIPILVTPDALALLQLITGADVAYTPADGAVLPSSVRVRANGNGHGHANGEHFHAFRSGSKRPRVGRHMRLGLASRHPTGESYLAEVHKAISAAIDAERAKTGRTTITRAECVAAARALAPSKSKNAQDLVVSKLYRKGFLRLLKANGHA